MQRETKNKDFFKTPTYPGGQKALKKFIAENLQYPAEALAAKVEGTVRVEYQVNDKGQVISAKATSGPGYGCEEEALRIVRLLEFTPARNRKIKATFRKKIQIHFRLSQAKPQKTAPPPTPPVAFQYTWAATPAKKAASKPKNKPRHTYQISITPPATGHNHSQE